MLSSVLNRYLLKCLNYELVIMHLQKKNAKKSIVFIIKLFFASVDNGILFFFILL